jgi:hypothetical protein
MVDSFAEDQLIRRTEHRSNARDAVGDVEQKNIFIERLARVSLRLRRHDVRVHLGEAGHKILAASVDAGGARRNGHRLRRSYDLDAVAPDDHRLIGDEPLGIHGQHGNVRECVDRRRVTRRARARCSVSPREQRRDARFIHAASFVQFVTPASLKDAAASGSATNMGA